MNRPKGEWWLRFILSSLLGIVTLSTGWMARTVLSVSSEITTLKATSYSVADHAQFLRDQLAEAKEIAAQIRDLWLAIGQVKETIAGLPRISPDWFEIKIDNVREQLGKLRGEVTELRLAVSRLEQRIASLKADAGDGNQ